VALNSGQPVATTAGQYLTLDRQWRRDVVRLRLPMPLRIEAADPPWGRSANSLPRAVDRAVLLKGPLVLVLDGENNANFTPLWEEAHTAGVRPILIVPAAREGGACLGLSENRDESVDKQRDFCYPASHYTGIWELPEDPARARGPLRVKGRLTPFSEVTGSPKPSHVQFVFRVRTVDAEQYASQYRALLGDPAFEMADAYRSFLKEAQITKTRVARLIECINRDKYSYDAVLAARDLGAVGDPAAMPPLVECLKTDNILLQRTAVAAIERLGRPDQQAVRALQELAQKVPELRGNVRGALAKLGSTTPPETPGDRTVSWIQCPADAREYVVRRTLSIDRQAVEKVDIRVCSWDVWDVYEVSLGGKIAGVKPTWAHTKFMDLTSLLQPGDNELLIRVIRREKLPEQFVKTWTLGAGSLPPGIIAKLRIEYRDRREESIYTDASWTAAALPAATTGQEWMKNAAGLPWAPCMARSHTGGNPFSYSYGGD
jgi:hypothetical protein